MAIENQAADVPNWRNRLAIERERFRRAWEGLQRRTHRAIWHSKDGWRRLTDGMEVEDLWAQFKADARASSRFYKQDLDVRTAQAQQPWTQPFKIIGALFISILKKLSP